MSTHDWFKQDELAAIGLVAVESASLELRVETMVGVLLNLSPTQVSALVGKGMMEGKLTTLANVAGVELEPYPELLKELSDLVSKIRDNNAERTTVIHGIWINASAAWDDGSLVLRFMKEPQAEKYTRHNDKMRRATISGAKKLAASSAETDEQLANLMGKVRVSRQQAIPSTPEEPS
jgi:hypothetical protein